MIDGETIMEQVRAAIRRSVTLVTWLAMALTIVPCRQAEAAQLFSISPVGLWQGAAFSNDQTHQFSHCSAWVPYRSGTTMYVTVNRIYAWNLAFLNPAWNLTLKQQIPLAITFDDRSPWTGSGTAIGQTMAMIPMADNSSLINVFRGAYEMKVLAAGQTFVFNLDGTSRLMLELVSCVRGQLALERGDQPPRIADGQPRSVNPSAPPPQPAQTQSELLAMRVASNLLLQAKFPNAQIVSQAETPKALQGHGVMWKSDIGGGAVDVVPRSAGTDAQQIASNLIAGDGAGCKGDFASGRSSELVDGKIVVRAFTGCKDSTGANSLHYFVLAGPGEEFIVYAVLNRGAVPVPPESPLADPAFQAAAVKASFAP